MRWLRRIVVAMGYTCNRVEGVHEYMMGGGATVYCDDFTYVYEVTQPGGRYKVVPH